MPGTTSISFSEHIPISTQDLPDDVRDLIQLQEKWCMLRRCEDDLNLLGEWDAVKEILGLYESLDVQVVTIENKVMAFHDRADA